MTRCVYNNGVVDRYFYRSATSTFGITAPLNGEPATHGNGMHAGAHQVFDFVRGALHRAPKV